MQLHDDDRSRPTPREVNSWRTKNPKSCNGEGAHVQLSSNSTKVDLYTVGVIR
jgi:hypothetical protein